MHAGRNPSAPLDGTASRVDSSVPVANRRGRGGSGTPGPSPVARGSATRRDVMNGGGSGGGRRGDRHGHRTSGDAPHKENSRRTSNNSSPVSGAAPSGGRNVASLALDVLEQELTSDTPPPMTTATASPSPSLEYCQQQQQQPPSLPSPGNRVREHAPRRSSTSGNVSNHPSTTCIDSPSEYVSLPSLPTVTSTPVKKPTQSRRPSSTSDVPSPLGARKTTKSTKAPGEAGGGGKGSSSGTGVSATPQHPTRNGSNGSRNAPAMSMSLPSSPRRNSSTGPLLSPLPLAGPTDTTALTPQQQQPSVAPVPSPHAQVVNQLFKSVAGTKPQEALPLIIEQLKSQQQQQQQQHTPTRGDTGDHPAPVTTARKSAATTATARIPPAPAPPLTHSKANQQQPSTTTTANSSPSTTPRQLVPPPPPPPPSASSTTTARQQDQQRVSSSSLSGTSRSQRSSTSRSSSSLIPASGNGNTTTTTTTTPHAPATAIPWSSPSCNQTLNSMSIDEDALLSPLPTATGMPSAFLLHEATPLGSGQYGVPRNNSTTTLASGAPSPSTSSLQGAVATNTGGVTAAGYMYPSVFASRSGRVSPQNTPHMRNGLVPTFTTTNTVNNAVGSCQTLPLEECSRSDVSSMFSINSVDLQEFIYEFRMAKEAVVNGAAAGIGALDSTSREGPGGGYPRGQDAGHRNSGGGGDDEGAAHRTGAAADGSSWGESHPHQHSNAAEQRKRESMADSIHNNSSNNSGRDEITVEELALILDRVAFPVLDMALLSDLFDELSDSAAAANGVTGFQGSSCGAVPAAMVGGSVNSTGNSSAFFSPSVRNSLVAAAVSRSASATLLNSQHCSPGAQSLPRTSPANNALAGYGGANHNNNNGSVGNTSAASGYASLPSATSRRSGGAPRLVGHNGAGGDGNAFSYAHPQGSSSGYGLPSALPIPDVAAAPSHAPPARSSGIVGKSSKRSSVDTAVAAAPVGIAVAGHVHDSINGDRNNNGRDGPAPTVDFEVFLARMAFKIQGRYPTEVVRSAFFRTVDTLARQRHQRSPPPHSSDTPDTADTISCTSIFTDGGANAWASHTTTAAGGEREDSGCCSTSTDTDADNSPVPLSPCGNTEGCCPADASDTATCAPTPTQRSRSRNDTSTASGAHGASGCGSRRGESPTTNTLHSVSASSDLACHSELPPPPPMQQPHGSGEREDEEDRHRPRGGMAPSGASTDSLAMAAAAVFSNGDKEHLAFERTVTDDAGGEEEREEDGLDPSPPLLDTVTLRDCLTLGIQRYLGFRDFNGVDAQQALRRSGFPDNNLNITLHMNDFIRLVHALAAVVYGGCGGGGGGGLSGTVSVPGGSSPATGSMLLSTPAATGYQLRRSSSHGLLGSPRPPDGHVMSTAAKRAFM